MNVSNLQNKMPTFLGLKMVLFDPAADSRMSCWRHLYKHKELGEELFSMENAVISKTCRLVDLEICLLSRRG